MQHEIILCLVSLFESCGATHVPQWITRTCITHTHTHPNSQAKILNQDSYCAASRFSLDAASAWKASKSWKSLNILRYTHAHTHTHTHTHTVARSPLSIQGSGIIQTVYTNMMTSTWNDHMNAPGTRLRMPSRRMSPATLAALFLPVPKVALN